MLLDTLFSGLPVVTEERTLCDPLPDPHPDDLAAVALAVEKRKNEYLAGRHCARLGLARMGVHDFLLRAGPDRAPLWPPGIVGSITHTGAQEDGFCGVVLARTQELLSVGVDAELAAPLPGELWTMVLTPRERALAQVQPAPERGLLATLYFSAKESVYKALYPLERRFIDFQEVELEMSPSQNRFQARLRLSAVEERVVPGRFLHAPGLILTGVAVVESR
jgi:4'-phosphopantetheinyl transferase EntD